MRFTPFAFIGKEYPTLNIQYLIVGGGGAGGQEDGAFLTDAGGGGAGQFVSGSGSVVLNPDVPYSVVVGAGGGWTAGYNRGNGGSSSIFLGQTALGGGGGGARLQLDGGAGASGGGANYLGTTTGTGGTGTNGFNGANAFYSATPSPAGTYLAGCGGGALTTASVGNVGPVYSIPGQPKAWLDGNVYAGGGNSADSAAITSAIYFNISGSGGTGNTSGVSDVLPGRNGIVKLRYSGSSALFTGGEIAISGGYVYHTFPSTSLLIPINQNQN